MPVLGCKSFPGTCCLQTCPQSVPWAVPGGVWLPVPREGQMRKVQTPRWQGQHWSLGAVEHEFCTTVWGQGLPYSDCPSSPSCFYPMFTFSGFPPPAYGQRTFSGRFWPMDAQGQDLRLSRSRRLLGSYTLLQVPRVQGLVGGRMELASSPVPQLIWLCQLPCGLCSCSFP